MKIKEILKLIPCFSIPIIIFIIQYTVLMRFGVYTKYVWFDIPMHFIGGCAIAYSFILVLNKLYDKVIINDKLIRILIIVSFVGFVAIFWEFYEHLVNVLLNDPINVYGDTMLDLLMGLLGGLVIALIKDGN